MARSRANARPHVACIARERTLLAPFALWRSADTIEVPDERQRGAASGVQASPFCVGGGGAPPHIAAAATADPEMAPPIRRREFGDSREF